VETLGLEHVAKLFQELFLFQTERQSLLQREARLLQSLLAVLQTQYAIQGPDAWVEVIQDVGLSNSVFSSRELAESDQTESKVEPSIG